MSEQLILEAIKDVKADVQANTEATQANTVAQAVLTERVDNMIKKTDEHIASDKTTHEALTAQVVDLKLWRENIKGKVAAYVGIAGVIVTFVIDLGKEALASMLNH